VATEGHGRATGVTAGRLDSVNERQSSMKQSLGNHRQRGMTMLSWLFVLGIAVFFVLIGIKMVPTYLENYSVRQVLANMENDRTLRGGTQTAIRDSFFKRLKINSVYEFDKRWIKISKQKEGNLVEVDYEIRKPVLGNVSIVMAFSESAMIPHP
jgi:hypothetical protein